MRMSSLAGTFVLAGLSLSLSAAEKGQPEAPVTAGIQRAPHTVVHFDVSPPLREIAPLAIPESVNRGRMIVDPGPDPMLSLGPQDRDQVVQSWTGLPRIPGPIVSFDGPGNVSGVAPPDPVGDVGPNHYVAMSNLSFQIFDKSGVSVFGPAANNTLWSGFGGACQTENSGDPIVLYDQIADRWLLTQFTSAGPSYFNCVALSTTGDPTGTYYRWAFSTGTNFPDYPKYGVWPNAYFISTREFAGASFAGVGAYAVNRQQMLAGNPAPQVISFFVPPGGTPYNVGDGLLPSDLDGSILPPSGSPNYFVGSMDNGGPYGAPQDALTLWKFDANFANPPASSFTLTNTIAIAAFDTVFPCSGRACIPQPDTSNRLDILSYRQRPLHRLAYRNFGSHEALVTNQSVDVNNGMAGIRWWEIRSPNSAPVIFQEGTYAPGTTDGVHRWMGSAAMDSAGNIALGYSASSSTVYPSVRYTGRLASDPLGTMPQGEQEIHAGTGSQTGGGNRWGDYTSLNVDPTDDCTFWHVNEYVPTTSERGWRLRIGSFRFNECGSPGFTLGGTPSAQAICAGDPAEYQISVGAISGFNNPVALSVAGHPAPSSALFSTNPVVPAGSSTLTIGNTGAVAAGNYTLTVNGTASGADPRSAELELSVFAGAPNAVALTTPANGAVGQSLSPVLNWSAVSGAQLYRVEVATDAGFANIVFDATLAGTSIATSPLQSNTHYYWRVTASNACGDGTMSAVFNFKTAPAPGDCDDSTTAATVYSQDFTGGAGGFTTTGSSGASTWTLSTARPSPLSGGNAFYANDIATVSDQRLISPTISLPPADLPITLKFQNWRNMENDGTSACFDGGILEISVNGGAFAQVPSAKLLNDSYRGPLSAQYQNPLAGLSAWCEPTAGRPYADTLVDLSDWAGSNIQLRWRLGTDNSVAREGWYVDDIRVQACQADSGDDVIFANDFEAPPTP